jgi:KN17 SH3-like C-terminal domain
MAAEINPVHRPHCRGAWLRKGLVVKIMSPELKAEGLYKKKGNVLRLINKQVANSLTCHCKDWRDVRPCQCHSCVCHRQVQ